MKTLLTLLLILGTPLCHAQKWVDEKGKVYYGDPPPGVKVRREAIKGGATSTVGTPERSAGRAPGGRALDQQEADFQKRNEARLARERQREREDRIISNNREVMKHQREMAERGLVPSYGPGPKPKR